MWWRLRREESNRLMKECVKEQIEQSLPWILEINKIACKLELDLSNATEMSKEEWKILVKNKVAKTTKDEFEKEINDLKGYRMNVEDELVVGKKKWYTSLCQRKAKIWFRMRADIIDPAPRQPYHPLSIWRCKFCDENNQSTIHYVKECSGIDKDLFDGLDRGAIYRTIQTLDSEEEVLHKTTQILMKVYQLINR